MLRLASSLFCLCALSAAFAGEANAQAHEIPVLNSIGRFLGYGYTQGGYHSQTGRLRAIHQRHPASNYPSRNLQYAYHPNYRPNQPPRSQFSLPQRHPQANGPAYQAPGQTPTLAPTPSEPAQPKAPTPEWLKQYLRNRLNAPLDSPPASTVQERELLDSPSPNDRAPLLSPGDDLLGDNLPGDNLLSEPSEDLLSDPEDNLLPETDDLLDGSDDLLDGSDDLLDGADEDLLLLDNGISMQKSTQQRSTQPRVATESRFVPVGSRRPVPSVNRYRSP